ncbi:MAG: FAD-dependent oxidoreductase [Clostridia bacterium]|nr:FAD-dependent oxidoreductase [Clostridia bacterium]
MQYTIDVKQGKKYDIIVCGGGTAGVFAAIAAARQGASVLLIERTFSVGGMLTVGNAGITKFTEHCKDVDKYKSEVLDSLAVNPQKVQVVGGLAKEYVKRMIHNNTAVGTSGEAGSYVFTDRYQAQLTLIEMLEEAGVEILYDTRVCMVNTSDGKVTSVVTNNKDGFTGFTADRYVDATGDADVAYLAGVPCRKGATALDVAEGGASKVGEMVQMGAMYRVRNVDFDRLFEYLNDNTDRFFQHKFGVMSLEDAQHSYHKGQMCVFSVLVNSPDAGLYPVQVYNQPQKDEAILLDRYCGAVKDGLNAFELSDAQNILQKGASVSLSYLKSIPGFENAKILHVPDVGVRETRHIDGEYILTSIDVVSGRDFEDSIACGGHPVDIGRTLPPEIEHMDMNHWRFHIPYRIMLPQNIDNLIVAGRSVSTTCIAWGAIRPTAQCMAMGEAAGAAAAVSIKDNANFRDVDIRKLQKTLTDNGAII